MYERFTVPYSGRELLVVFVLLTVRALFKSVVEPDDFALEASEAWREVTVPGTVLLLSEYDEAVSEADRLVRSVDPLET